MNFPRRNDLPPNRPLPPGGGFRGPPMPQGGRGMLPGGMPGPPMGMGGPGGRGMGMGGPGVGGPGMGGPGMGMGPPNMPGGGSLMNAAPNMQAFQRGPDLGSQPMPPRHGGGSGPPPFGGPFGPGGSPGGAAPGRGGPSGPGPAPGGFDTTIFHAFHSNHSYNPSALKDAEKGNFDKYLDPYARSGLSH